jgi:hypothetical protein
VDGHKHTRNAMAPRHISSCRFPCSPTITKHQGGAVAHLAYAALEACAALPGLDDQRESARDMGEVGASACLGSGTAVACAGHGFGWWPKDRSPGGPGQDVLLAGGESETVPVEDDVVAQDVPESSLEASGSGAGAESLPGTAEGPCPVRNVGERSACVEERSGRRGVGEHQGLEVVGHRVEIAGGDVGEKRSLVGDPVPDVALFVPFQPCRVHQRAVQKEGQFAAFEPGVVSGEEPQDGSATRKPPAATLQG